MLVKYLDIRRTTLHLFYTTVKHSKKANKNHTASSDPIALASTRERHMGQVECDANHMSMQATWNLWLHPGSSLPFSPVSNSVKHTAHSSFSSSAAMTYTKIGNVDRTSLLSLAVVGREISAGLSKEKAAVMVPFERRDIQ